MISIFLRNGSTMNCIEIKGNIMCFILLFNININISNVYLQGVFLLGNIFLLVIVRRKEELQK